jgi:NADH-quinone oxidoreductase subunit L
MSTTAFAFAATFAPAAAAIALAVAPPLRRRLILAATISITGALVSLGAAVAALAGVIADASPHLATAPWLTSGGHALVDAGVRADGISAPMLVVVAFVALCVQVFSVGYLDHEREPSLGRYFGLQSLFLFSMQLLVIAPNLLQLFAGWELVGATSYFLIGYWYEKPSAARAAVKAFWVTKFADMGLLVGLLLLASASGGFDWTASLDQSTATAVTLLLFIAVIGKSAQFPLHVWLPDAMEGPTPVSALLHAATMVAAGVYLVVRADPLFAQAPATREIMAYLGAGSALFAALLALVQTDLKRVLAYSTCSQLGYMLAAIGAGSSAAGFFHLTTHAFFKALLFLAAGSVIHAVGSNELSRMGGLARRMPLTAAVFIIGACSLAGIPGLAGFFSKDLVLDTVARSGLWLPAIALYLTAFLTALYMGRALLLAFFGPGAKEAHAHEPGFAMRLPLILLVIPAVIAGYFGTSLNHLSGSGYEFRFSGTTILASVLALAGFGVAWLVWGTRRGAEPVPLVILARFASGAWVNRAYELTYRRVLLAISDGAAWFDRYVVDGLVNAAGAVFVTGSERARRVQTGNVQDYLWAVSIGAILLVAWSLVP